MVAGVETREHPPSSLEGVEQPSEAILKRERERKSSFVCFSRLTILSLKKKKKKKASHSVLQKEYINVSTYVARGQKLFSNYSTINGMPC